MSAKIQNIHSNIDIDNHDNRSRKLHYGDAVDEFLEILPEIEAMLFRITNKKKIYTNLLNNGKITMSYNSFALQVRKYFSGYFASILGYNYGQHGQTINNKANAITNINAKDSSITLIGSQAMPNALQNIVKAGQIAVTGENVANVANIAIPPALTQDLDSYKTDNLDDIF